MGVQKSPEQEEWKRRERAAYEASNRAFTEWMEGLERRRQHFKRYKWFYRTLTGLGLLLLAAGSIGWGIVVGTLIWELAAPQHTITRIDPPVK